MPVYALQRLSGLDDLSDMAQYRNQAQAIEQNWQATQGNIQALSDDLRSIPFMGGSADSSAGFADQIGLALTKPSVEGLVGLSVLSRDSSQAILDLERTLFSWKGAAIAGSAVFALVALGWWLRGRRQQRE